MTLILILVEYNYNFCFSAKMKRKKGRKEKLEKAVLFCISTVAWCIFLQKFKGSC